MVKGLVGAIVGGLVGAAIWAALAYFIKIHHTGVALAVGGLVGFCAGKAAGSEAGFRVGLMAAVVTLVAVLGGKYAAVHFTVENKFVKPASQIAITDEILTMVLADGIAADREAAGQKLAWPAGKSRETLDKTPKDYPADVWAAAVKQWEGMPSSAREALREKGQAELRQAVGEIGKDAEWEKYKSSFATMDYLLIGLAMAAALGVAAGGG